MGYRAKKEEEKKKGRALKIVLLCILFLSIIALSTFAFFVSPGSWEYYFRLPKVGKRQEGELRIHCIDVGQGDATLLELPDGKVALIDGGKNKSESKKSLLRYINALEIDVIDYLIVTHTDNDHCGGLEEVFKYKKVLNAYLPSSFSVSNGQFAEVYAAAVEEECEIVNFSRSVSLSKKEGVAYILQFLYPYSMGLQGNDLEDNENSAVLWLDYQGVSALFCGDAPHSVENILMRDDKLGLLNVYGVELTSTEILKVAHHGSEQSSSEEFLQYLGVKTAVVSCGENSYGHPSAVVLANLSKVGAGVYRTDTDGHIMTTVTANGQYETKKISRA